jgi:hypothetical protein
MASLASKLLLLYIAVMGFKLGTPNDTHFIENQNGYALVWTNIYSATLPGDFYARGSGGAKKLPVPVFMPKETSAGVYTAEVKTYGDSMTAFGEPFTGNHTYKYYWFGFDGENFFEYGGRNITEEEFLTFAGSEAILSEIKAENGKVTGILRRPNGIININYSGHDDGVAEGWNYNNYKTYTLESDDSGNTSLVYFESGGGIYLPSITAEYGEDLALYDFPELTAKTPGK